MNTAEDLYQYDEEFRNTIATVDEKGKRIWLYPKKPSGNLHQRRIMVTVLLLSLFFGGPFITIDGQPLLLLNVFARKFVIFGQVFWPQDFVLLAIILITFFVFIILFTVVFGRIWCGWMCPQTLFMEMVFRKIEYWLEGDGAAQRKLKEAAPSLSKVSRNIFKHFLFILISLLIAHTAMAYLIGIHNTLEIIQHAPSENIAGFTGLLAFTTIFYLVYARFREQACIAVCPYGRLQGVLLIKDSIVVAYDWIRGEPRGKLKKRSIELAPSGDCIDCKLCVHVCPTGIDIRNGTQLECVNCTACIDACDEVMIKINKPTGLIRFTSYNSIKDGIHHLFTPRVIGYSFVLVALIGLLSFSLITRSEVETNVFKVSGTLFQNNNDGYISNLYNIEFVNKTFDRMPLELKIESPAAAELLNPDGKSIEVPAEGMLKKIYFIRIPSADLSSSRTIVYLGVYRNGTLVEKVKVKFIGPVSTIKPIKP
ncbi:MAG: cytochrome c oxidase accessory protein CcoG [Cyclobacteriaceae bacterium]|nr:cytochrome c oxidase accessory protein CcoG [Cyclobacteriaceae bacterium]